MPNIRRGVALGESGDSDCAARAKGAVMESRNGSDRAMPAPCRKRRREIDRREEMDGAPPVGPENGFMGVTSFGTDHFARFHARSCAGQIAERWKVGRFFRFVRG